MAFVKIEKGYRSPFGPGRQTVIRCASRLKSRIDDHGVSLGDLGRDPNVTPEPLVIRATKQAGRRGKPCEIPDTPIVRRYREEMDTINRWIGQADLVCCGLSKDGEEIADDDRFLKRIFNNGSLEKGGRLFGGFWQRLRKEDRLRDVLIGNEPVVALDFGQMAPRIGYALAGASPPPGDLYCVPPFEYNRRGIKTVLNALLSAEKWPKRFPMGARSGFSSRTTVDDVLRAIRQAHGPLGPLFATGACHRISLVESQILIATLLRLIGDTVVALPIHDCLLVPKSARDVARVAMLDCFREITGIEGVVGDDGTESAASPSPASRLPSIA